MCYWWCSKLTKRFKPIKSLVFFNLSSLNSLHTKKKKPKKVEVIFLKIRQFHYFFFSKRQRFETISRVDLLYTCVWTGVITYGKALYHYIPVRANITYLAVRSKHTSHNFPARTVCYHSWPQILGLSPEDYKEHYENWKGLASRETSYLTSYLCSICYYLLNLEYVTWSKQLIVHRLASKDPPLLENLCPSMFFLCLAAMNQISLNLNYTFYWSISILCMKRQVAECCCPYQCTLFAR